MCVSTLPYYTVTLPYPNCLHVTNFFVCEHVNVYNSVSSRTEGKSHATEHTLSASVIRSLEPSVLAMLLHVIYTIAACAHMECAKIVAGWCVQVFYYPCGMQMVSVLE